MESFYFESIDFERVVCYPNLSLKSDFIKGGTIMTMKEWIQRLSQLRDLKREVDELSQRIAQLEAQAQGGASRISGLPRGSGRVDRMAELIVKIESIEDRMERRRLDCMEELGRLYAFIDSVDDSRTRQVLCARYIDGLSWQDVAWRIDETDEQVPRRLHNRFLQQKTEENAQFDEKDERNVL